MDSSYIDNIVDATRKEIPSVIDDSIAIDHHEKH